MSQDKFAVEPLDTDNYATWSIKMRAVLQLKGVWNAVINAASASAEHTNQALALIILHIKDHHLPTVGSCSTAQLAWETLKNIYEGKSNARKLQLRKDLTQLKMGAGEPVAR